MSFELEPSLASSQCGKSHTRSAIVHGEDPLALGVAAVPDSNKRRGPSPGLTLGAGCVGLGHAGSWYMVHDQAEDLVESGPEMVGRAWEVSPVGSWEVLSTLCADHHAERQSPQDAPIPCLANIHIHRSASIK